MKSTQEASDLIRNLQPLFLHDPETARIHLHNAVDDAMASGNDDAGYLLLDELAWQATSHSDAQDALPCIRRLLDLAEQSGDPVKIGGAHNTYGVFFLNAGESLASIEQFSIALDAFETAGIQSRIASVLSNIGELLIYMDDFRRAGLYLAEASRLTDVDSRPEIGILEVYPMVENGLVKEAWQRLVQVWRSGRRKPGWPMRANVHEAAGWIRLRSGDDRGAIRHYERAVRLYGVWHDPFRMTFVHLSLGDIRAKRKESEAAEEYRLAAEISGMHGYLLQEIKALRKLLPVTSGPMEGVAVQQRLNAAMKQSDERDRMLRRNFVDIRIRSEAVRQERIRLEKDYERDALTGLLSYRRFGERLTAISQENSRFAFLFMDVDRLKIINDRLGHAAGDMLLRSFARDIADALPNGGQAIRKSGDEFIVLLPGADWEQTRIYLQTLYAKLAVGRNIGTETMVLTCSAGAALWPADTDRLEPLEWMADQAMYKAKSLGRNRWARATDK